ncbi:hypothetical protein Q4598_20010 [Phaeobacter inhibens]|uniref:hypothetical protein n=1 Tax=Phaeobacter inhibens TaxID=221822 RepID=UPI0026E380A5|nr:hypothetical protein [Phaeobacter inhibens]MDO6758531.1 hypothetical protein [Phaeobacter inhibens]
MAERAYFEDAGWHIATPSQYRCMKNASIPDSRLSDHGLHEVQVPPRPDVGPEQTIRLGEIQSQDGLPVREWVIETLSEVDAQAAVAEAIQRRRDELRRLIRDHYSAAMSVISADYPLEEREGWPEQIEAAKEVLAGGQNQLIETLAAPRGKTPAAMAQTVMTKRAQYQAVYGAMTATLHAHEAAIAAATDLANLNLIDPAQGWQIPA